jgi:hypothetical protein
LARASAATGHTARAGAAALIHGENGAADQITADLLTAVADRTEELYREAEEIARILRRAIAGTGGPASNGNGRVARGSFRPKDQMTETTRAAQLIATQMATEGAAPADIEAVLTTRFGPESAELLLADLDSRSGTAAA